MQIDKHPNAEKINIGKVDISSGYLTFFDPYGQIRFPNSLNQTLGIGSFDAFLYKFKNPPKNNGIIAIELIFNYNEPIIWEDADYFDDPKSDFHYTNSCGFIADTSVFKNETIDGLNKHIKKATTATNELNYCQLKFGNDIKCVYFECGIGWYDQVVDLKWGFDNNGKVCRFLVDFHSYLL